MPILSLIFSTYKRQIIKIYLAELLAIIRTNVKSCMEVDVMAVMSNPGGQRRACGRGDQLMGRVLREGSLLSARTPLGLTGQAACELLQEKMKDRKSAQPSAWPGAGGERTEFRPKPP